MPLHMIENELTLSEMLDDPIFQQLLASDRISRVDFEDFILTEVVRHLDFACLEEGELSVSLATETPLDDAAAPPIEVGAR